MSIRRFPSRRSATRPFRLTCHINSPNTNIMPRIGLAYRLDDKTVIRAGYGMFYARVMGATLQDLFTANGVTTRDDSLSSSIPTQLTCGPFSRPFSRFSRLRNG